MASVLQNQAASHLTTATTTFGSPLTAGSAIYVWVHMFHGTAVATPTRNDGGAAFTALGTEVTQGSYRGRWFRSLNPSLTTASLQVTCVNDSNNGVFIAVVEMGGVDQTTPEDVAVTSATGSNSAQPRVMTGPAITPTTAGAFILSGVAGQISGADPSAIAVPTQGGTWTSRGQSLTHSSTNWGAAASLPWSSGAVTPVWGATISDTAATNYFVVNVAVRPAAAGDTAAITLAPFTSSASGSVVNPPAVGYVKEVGFVTNTTAGGTSAITVAAGGVPIGDTVVVYGACDNSGSGGAATTITVTDTRGNTYTTQSPQAIADPGAASAGIQGFFAVANITTALQAGDTITVTYGNTTTAKAINAQQFTGVHATTPVLSGTYATQDNQTGTSNSVSATPTAALQAVCALIAVEGGTADTFTEDSDTTNGAWVTLTRRGSGTTTAGATLNSVYKIVTASGAQTYNPALGTARDHAAAILVLDFATPVSGTSAVTLGAFTSSATGSTTSGTAAITLAPFTSTASGTSTPPPITGTAAVTLAAFTSSASGSFGSGISGTAAVTLGSFTSSASGTVVAIVGTSARTLGSFTSSASGTFTAAGISGTVAVTLGSFTASATGLAYSGLFPVAVSANGRYLEDQNGNPWFGIGDTAWSMSAQIDDADSTLYLEDRADKGFNFVVMSAPEHAFTDNSPPEENTYGQLPFTGTAFQSTPTDAYWDHVEFKVSEALRLGITMLICPQYLGFPGSDEGWNDEVVAASNAQMTTYGQALAARFAPYPNIAWLIGHDRIPSATEMARSKAVADALQAGTSHLVTVGAGDNGLTGVENWSGSGVAWDFDTGYRRSTLDYVTHTADGYSNSPTIPFGFFEPLYEGDGASRAQCRYALYGPMCAGACYVFFGNHPIWHFGSANWGGGGDWVAALDSGGSQDAERFVTFMATLNADWLADMTPDTTDTFLTSGEGSSTTQAATRFDGTTTSGVIAVAYRPNGGSATLTFDLTELNQVTSVRVRKFDPTNGTYTTINTYATTGSQAIGSLGTNSAGDGDWVLVFDPGGITGSSALTLGSFTSSASGAATPPAFTGTTAITLAPFTSTASGAVTPPAFTGTAAVTLGSFTASASGTFTPTPVTGTAAVTLGSFTASASGTALPPGAGGSASITLAPFVTSASGTFTPQAITGTAARTLAPFTAAGSGSVTAPAFTGSAAITLGSFIAQGSEGNLNSIDLCITFGAPVFPNSVGMPVFVTRDVDAPIFDAHIGEAPDVEGHMAGAPDIRVRDVGVPMFVDRETGLPVTQDRSTTIMFAHGNPGELVIECEE